MPDDDLEQAVDEEPYIEDTRRPWQRASELLEAGHDWERVKWCMVADYRARLKFANMLGDDDMAQLAEHRFYSIVKQVEGDDFDQAQIDAWIERIDRQINEPPEDRAKAPVADTGG